MILSAGNLFDGIKFGGAATVALDGSNIAAVKQGKDGAGLLMPGIIDSHVHLLSVGLGRLRLDLSTCGDRESFAAALKQYAGVNRAQWILGRGWDDNRLGFVPDRRTLDCIMPHRPVALTRVCGHVLAANSRALQQAGINKNTAAVPGGVIKRDERGAPTGILEEKAMDLVQRHIPPPEDGQLYDALSEAVQYAHSCGVTGVQTDDMLIAGSYSQLWELYRRVTARHPLRAQLHYHIHSAGELRQYIAIRDQLEPTDMIFPGAAKLFLDGSLGAGTAALRQPYADDPENRGVLTCSDEELAEIIALAEERNIQLALHAIGDAAIAQALTLIAAARGGERKGINHRLIHCQVTDRKQIRQMAALGLVAEIQPVFLQTDKDWAEKRLGAGRLQTSYCWRDMWDAGLWLAGGSDSPVETINPWWGIHTAVTRTDNGGNPARGWQRDQSLAMEQALTIFTANNARLANWPGGAIRPGAWADVVVYTQFDDNCLWQTSPDQVIIGGQTVWQR